MLKKNDKVTLTVTDVNNLGFGVAHHEGLTVFIGGCLDGEVVDAHVVTVKKTYAIAKPLKVTVPSPHRISNDCGAKGCGGCAYRTMTYSQETHLKEAYVKNAFKKAGLGDVQVSPLVTTGEISHYRNKAQYPVGDDGKGGYAIGFYAPKSHRVIDAMDCPLQPREFREILLTVRSYLEKYRIPAYHEETGEGLIRHIYLRRGSVTKEILVTLVLTKDTLPHEDVLVKALVAHNPRIVGVLVNTNPKNTNVILGDTYRTLWGRDYIEDVLCGIRLQIAAPSFYQVNHDAAELLYQKGKELAGLTGEEQLLDLFCGAGSIGLAMADSVKELVGVEIVEEAVENAKANAALNSISNAKFFCGDAGDVRHLLDTAAEHMAIHPDVVILDPPRRGCSSDLLRYLSGQNIPKIVYISCNPDTLARDAKMLTDLGYAPSDVTPFDLFPRTGHVESVMGFCRKNPCFAGDTHRMQLHDAPFEMMKKGEKTVELRLCDEKRKKLKVGDRIVFTNTANGDTIERGVLKLHHFSNFEELYRSLPLTQCGYTKETADTAKASDMEAYYSPEEQAKYGVLGIELCPLSQE